MVGMQFYLLWAEHLFCGRNTWDLEGLFTQFIPLIPFCTALQWADLSFNPCPLPPPPGGDGLSLGPLTFWAGS